MSDMQERKELLALRQSYSLEEKIKLTKLRIREWYEAWEGQVYVSFSGGKDSTVLLHVVREIYPGVPTVFINTGLQYPEVRRFALSQENVIELRPKMGFREVIERYGYPVVSKKVAHMLEDLQNPTDKNKATCHLYRTGWTKDGRNLPGFKLAKKWRFLIDAPFKVSDRCCDVMKKNPAKIHQRTTGSKPMLGSMVGDAWRRQYWYLRAGCNAFEMKMPRSMPLAFWTEQDVLTYLSETGIEYASVYGEIEDRQGKLVCTGEHNTGCVFCAFGIFYDGVPNRFQRLRVTHPSLHRYCMDKLGMREVLEFLGIPWE